MRDERSNWYYVMDGTHQRKDVAMARSAPLAVRLRVLRAQQGWSIETAAKQIGVTTDTLSDAERGKRRPYMPTLAKIARGYGVPVEELLAAADEGDNAPLFEPEPKTKRVTKDAVLMWGVEVTDAETNAINRALRLLQEKPDLLDYVIAEILSDEQAEEWERALRERTAA
jgi:transcriptional regulator with XRE-family HTH domain